MSFANNLFEQQKYFFWFGIFYQVISSPKAHNQSFLGYQIFKFAESTQAVSFTLRNLIATCKAVGRWMDSCSCWWCP
jgi:hypothetical protein